MHVTHTVFVRNLTGWPETVAKANRDIHDGFANNDNWRIYFEGNRHESLSVEDEVKTEFLDCFLDKYKDSIQVFV